MMLVLLLTTVAVQNDVTQTLPSVAGNANNMEMNCPDAGTIQTAPRLDDLVHVPSGNMKKQHIHTWMTTDILIKQPDNVVVYTLHHSLYNIYLFVFLNVMLRIQKTNIDDVTPTTRNVLMISKLASLPFIC